MHGTRRVSSIVIESAIVNRNAARRYNRAGQKIKILPYRHLRIKPDIITLDDIGFVQLAAIIALLEPSIVQRGQCLGASKDRRRHINWNSRIQEALPLCIAK